MMMSAIRSSPRSRKCWRSQSVGDLKSERKSTTVLASSPRRRRFALWTPQFSCSDKQPSGPACLGSVLCALSSKAADRVCGSLLWRRGRSARARVCIREELRCRSRVDGASSSPGTRAQSRVPSRIVSATDATNCSEWKGLPTSSLTTEKRDQRSGQLNHSNSRAMARKTMTLYYSSSICCQDLHCLTQSGAWRGRWWDYRYVSH